MPMTMDGTPFKQIDHIANEESEGLAAVFSQKDPGQETDGHADQSRQQQDFAAADDGVGHAAAGFAGRLRQFSKEIPVQGSSAMQKR